MTNITNASSPAPSSASSTNGKDDSGFLSYLFRGQGPTSHQSHQQQQQNLMSQSTQPQHSANQSNNQKSRQRKPTTNPNQNPNNDLEYPPLSLAESLLEKEDVETQLIMTLLHSYFSIVRKNLLDSVPKAIMHFLVNHVVEQLPTRLVSDLYKEEMFEELLEEDEAVVKQRARSRTALEAYRQAASILADLREISPAS